MLLLDATLCSDVLNGDIRCHLLKSWVMSCTVLLIDVASCTGMLQVVTSSSGMFKLLMNDDPWHQLLLSVALCCWLVSADAVGSDAVWCRLPLKCLWCYFFLPLSSTIYTPGIGNNIFNPIFERGDKITPDINPKCGWMQWPCTDDMTLVCKFHVIGINIYIITLSMRVGVK